MSVGLSTLLTHCCQKESLAGGLETGIKRTFITAVGEAQGHPTVLQIEGNTEQAALKAGPLACTPGKK